MSERMTLLEKKIVITDNMGLLPKENIEEIVKLIYDYDTKYIKEYSNGLMTDLDILPENLINDIYGKINYLINK